MDTRQGRGKSANLGKNMRGHKMRKVPIRKQPVLAKKLPAFISPQTKKLTGYSSLYTLAINFPYFCLKSFSPLSLFFKLGWKRPWNKNSGLPFGVTPTSHNCKIHWEIRRPYWIADTPYGRKLPLHHHIVSLLPDTIFGLRYE